MSTVVGLLGLAGFAAFWLWLNVSWAGSPVTTANDSAAYQALREGRPVCRPFRWRLAALLPFQRPLELGSLVLAPVLVAGLLLQRGVGLTAALCGGVLWLGLPGVWGFNARHRGLLDALALALVLLALVGPFGPGSLAVAGLAMLTKEATPIMLVLGSGRWEYLALLPCGLILALISKRKGECHPLGRRHQEVCERPFWAAKRYKSTGQYLSWQLLTPFGLTLLGLADPWALLAFVVGFGFTFLATDVQRVWQPFCALPLIAATVALVPVELLPALTALHLLNPLAGKGE